MRHKAFYLGAVVGVLLLALGAALAWGGHASADDPTPTPTAGVGPDLVVEDIYDAQQHSADCTTPAEAVIVVRNIGSASAGPSTTRVSVDSGDNTLLSTPGLAPGAAAMLGSPILGFTLWENYTAVADWNGEVAETNETNNSLSKYVAFATLPTCTVTPQPTPTNTPTPTATPTACPGDADCDGRVDAVDNCRAVFNPDQANSDAQRRPNGTQISGDWASNPAFDNLGDVCDEDSDNDALPDSSENESSCPYRLVGDSDGDTVLDGYDPTPCNSGTPPPCTDPTDSDGDGFTDCVEHSGYNTCASVDDAAPDYATCADPTDSDGDACADWIEIVDVNGNRQADILDLLFVTKRGLGINPGSDSDVVLDMDKNGSVNLIDALLAAKNSSLVRPHAQCMSEGIAWPTTDWESTTPAMQGMDSTALEGVADYCEGHGCRAVVVTRHGRLVWERYWEGWTKNSTDIGWSVTKSVTSALVGIAVAEGYIDDIDQSAADFIDEWQGTDEAQITLRNLLSMTSGLQWDETYSGESDVVKMFTAEDQLAYVLEHTLAYEPGTNWHYSSGDAELFSRILRVATGIEAKDYAQEKIFDVLGMPTTIWPTDAVGHTETYCCVTTTAREFAKFGYLYLRGGRWQDEQVVPGEWVWESTRPSQSLFPGYGLFWWLPDLADAPADTYEAVGLFQKRIYVIPSLDIVAVRLGATDSTWNDNDFLQPIVGAATGGG
jgi:CubicO group peptidase (beta-lactamase class C family)